MDLLAVQETLKSLFQHHSSKSINSLVLSFLYSPTFTFIHDYLIRWTCHTSICSLVLCLVTTKIWSNGHQRPRRVTALGSWTNHVIALRQISVTALFYLEDSRRIYPRSMRACQPKDLKGREWRRERGRERERAHTRRRGRERERFGSSLYIFLPPPGPALCKLGLARSAV